jgi:Phage protein (N4 Gp49/phage Sf6 gene 66) family
MPTKESEASIEAALNTKGLNAPRLTPGMIDGQILAEQYYVFPGTTMTICALTLRNGFVVIGESAAASPENFDEEIGQRIARDNARNKIWALEGYALRNVLSGRVTPNENLPWPNVPPRP